jgi:hypothetical protein
MSVAVCSKAFSTRRTGIGIVRLAGDHELMSIPPGLPAMDVAELLLFCARGMLKFRSTI